MWKIITATLPNIVTTWYTLAFCPHIQTSEVFFCLFLAMANQIFSQNVTIRACKDPSFNTLAFIKWTLSTWYPPYASSKIKILHSEPFFFKENLWLKKVPINIWAKSSEKNWWRSIFFGKVAFWKPVTFVKFKDFFGILISNLRKC